MRRLIWDFDGRTYDIVGNLVSLLNYVLDWWLDVYKNDQQVRAMLVSEFLIDCLLDELVSTSPAKSVH